MHSNVVHLLLIGPVDWGLLVCIVDPETSLNGLAIVPHSVSPARNPATQECKDGAESPGIAPRCLGMNTTKRGRLDSAIRAIQGGRFSTILAV